MKREERDKVWSVARARRSVNGRGRETEAAIDGGLSEKRADQTETGDEREGSR